jgi:hypothetical protein
MPTWLCAYLKAVHSMVAEADGSPDLRVKLAALRILELQPRTIGQLELDHFSDSLLSWRSELYGQNRSGAD